MITKEQYRWLSSKHFYGNPPHASLRRNAAWLEKHPNDVPIRNELILCLLVRQYEYYFFKRVLGNP